MANTDNIIFMENTIQTIIKEFTQLRILVLGETMLDVYTHGTSDRICQEAPVPIVAIKEEHCIPGGAANTAVNIKQLGGNVTFISVIGDDHEGQVAREQLQKHMIHTSFLFKERGRKTLVKKRVSADGQLLVRFDDGTTTNIQKTTEQKIIETLIQEFPKHDAVIVSDYRYGVLTDSIIQTLTILNKKIPQLCIVDSKDLLLFTNLEPTVVKPNYSQAVSLLGKTKLKNSTERVNQITQFGEHILDMSNARYAAVTLDIDGALLFQKGEHPYRTYTHPTQNVKAAGAGDTFVSALTLALGCKTDIQTAAEIASAASSLVVQKNETSTCTNLELLAYFATKGKNVFSLAELQSIISLQREQGYRIAFTNGCFDILHSGHVRYLNRAKDLADRLIVGINTDESVTKLKGSNRPINKLADRVAVLSALSAIDYIIPFSENTPVTLIKEIKPDVYVKGGDYTRESLPETPFVESYGGTVQIVPYVENYSTTKIIHQIRLAHVN